MTRRSLSPLITLALAAAALTGCSPPSAPAPSPTPAFATEDEAFAAAEKTYRAYIDAVNSEQGGGDASRSLDFLTGGVLNTEIRSQHELEASGIHITGATKILSFGGRSVNFSSHVGTINADVCLDISEVRASDREGTDVTTPGRSDVYGLVVTFIGSRDSLLIAEYEVDPGAPC